MSDERQCEQCGESFTPRQFNQRFCNRICSDTWHRDERRSALKLYRTAEPLPATGTEQ